MLVNTKLADCYQNLFNHLSSEHGLTLTISEMEQIVSLSQETTTLLQAYFQQKEDKSGVNYAELATAQFNVLMDETLESCPEAVGCSCDVNYQDGDSHFKIKVEGFWDKSNWFEWTAYDEQNNIIANGTELLAF